MMKKLVLLGSFAVAVVAQAQNVMYDGRPVRFGHDAPYTSGGVLMLPARDTLDRVGGSLDRNTSGMHVQLNWNRNRVQYQQGGNTFLFNGQRRELAGRSATVRGILYLPFGIFSTLTNGRLTRGGGGGGVIIRPPQPGPIIRPPHPGPGPMREEIYFDRLPVKMLGMPAPYRKGTTWMVPFRDFAKVIGARTDRTADGLRVWIYMGRNRVEYNKGNIWFRLNTNRRELPVTSDERSGVLYIPIQLFTAVSDGRVSVRRG